jgi:hypothetical protein
MDGASETVEVVRLVGIVSLADIAVDEGPENAGRALSGISEPGGEHSQSEIPGVR